LAFLQFEGTLVPFEDTLRPTRPVRFFSALIARKKRPRLFGLQ
jgi:hypothetical protein